jgi:hypothetical protein
MNLEPQKADSGIRTASGVARLLAGICVLSVLAIGFLARR